MHAQFVLGCSRAFVEGTWIDSHEMFCTGSVGPLYHSRGPRVGIVLAAYASIFSAILMSCSRGQWNFFHVKNL